MRYALGHAGTPSSRQWLPIKTKSDPCGALPPPEGNVGTHAGKSDYVRLTPELIEQS